MWNLCFIILDIPSIWLYEILPKWGCGQIFILLIYIIPGCGFNLKQDFLLLEVEQCSLSLSFVFVVESHFCKLWYFELWNKSKYYVVWFHIFSYMCFLHLVCLLRGISHILLVFYFVTAVFLLFLHICSTLISVLHSLILLFSGDSLVNPSTQWQWFFSMK